MVLNKRNKQTKHRSTFQDHFLSTNENLISIQKQWSVIQKFASALSKLQQAQNKIHNQPKYPFVLPLSMNEFMVHLGSNKVEIRMQNEIPRSIPLLACSILLSSSGQLTYSNNQTSDTQEAGSECLTRLEGYKEHSEELLQEHHNFCLQESKSLSSNSQRLVESDKILGKDYCLQKQLLNIRIFSSLLQHSDDPEEEEFRKAFRIISRIFIKKYAINYIFNSKIVQHNWHMRYRSQIYKGIKSPNNFSHIKNL